MVCAVKCRIKHLAVYASQAILASTVKSLSTFAKAIRAAMAARVSQTPTASHVSVPPALPATFAKSESTPATHCPVKTTASAI